MIILGLNLAIDATAVLLKDGEIVAAVAEERLSRKKLHLGFPRRAVKSCLTIGKLRGEDIDVAVVSFNEYLTTHPLITEILFHPNAGQIEPENTISILTLLKEGSRIANDHPGALLHEAMPWRWKSYNHRRYLDELHALGVTNARLETVDHHLAHAASAYFCSGFDRDVLIVTADGAGDGLSATLNIGKNGKIRRIQSVPKRLSFGLLYAAITKYLGFKPHRHEGKITGLAAYGNSEKTLPVLRRLLTVSPNGKMIGTIGKHPDARLAEQLRRFTTGSFLRQWEVNEMIGVFRRSFGGMRREDVAAGVQSWLEETVSQWVRLGLKETKCRSVALAGGVFANVRLNQRIAELPGLDHLYVHPNMGDGGTALGAALLIWQKHLGQQKKSLAPKTLGHVYFGPSYSDEDIKTAVRRAGLNARKMRVVERYAAKMIAKGKIVGWFQGRMEFGPRALGNRSLLAPATDRTINDTLNERLRRTEFMPFAPSVLDTDVSRYLKYHSHSFAPSRFMTITFDCTPLAKKTIPAVVHVDGTARPQVVERKTNSRYYRVLQEYKKLTGMGIFVNTSFNIHEEPIVCSPDDAIRSYKLGSCDILILGNYVVS